MTDTSDNEVKTAYCVKCKSKQQLINEQFVERTATTKVARITGNCNVCNSKISTFTKSKLTLKPVAEDKESIKNSPEIVVDTVQSIVKPKRTRKNTIIESKEPSTEENIKHVQILES